MPAEVVEVWPNDWARVDAWWCTEHDSRGLDTTCIRSLVQHTPQTCRLVPCYIRTEDENMTGQDSADDNAKERDRSPLFEIHDADGQRVRIPPTWLPTTWLLPEAEAHAARLNSYPTVNPPYTVVEVTP